MGIICVINDNNDNNNNNNNNRNGLKNEGIGFSLIDTDSTHNKLSNDI